MITDHCEKYPGLTLQDLFKFLYQSAFGCEHLLGHRGDVVEYLEAEYKSGGKRSKNEVEPLDGDYSRVHLGVMRDGLSKETFGTLFFLSAKHEENAAASLREKLEITWEMILEGALPFSEIEFNAAAKIWRKRGFPPLHHSEKFRSLYRPAYRLISNKFVPFLPLFTAIDKALETGEITLAIEGGAASGKSTLAALLEKIYGCTVFHTDDFFLQPAQRTPERLAEVGGNMDRERFLMDVLFPHSQGQAVQYRRFDCSSFTLLPPVEKKETPLTVIEGAYCMHPGLCHFYDFAVFMDISADVQKQRILKRNGEALAQRFFNEWIPMEEKYFTALHVKERCNMIIETE
jgi:uridine kinase